MRKLVTEARAWAAARGHDEEGAGMVEYGLLLALIVLVALPSVAALGVPVSRLYEVPW